MRIASLTEDRLQIEVSQGLIDFVILDASRGEGPSLEPNAEIDMPSVAARQAFPVSTAFEWTRIRKVR